MAFVEGAVIGYGLDADRIIFLGYSNGANFLAAFIQHHPGAVRRAVLLRAIQALETSPATDLSGTSVLMLNGRDDAFNRNAPALADALVARGAQVEFRELSADHELSAADVTEAAKWLRQNLSDMPEPSFVRMVR